LRITYHITSTLYTLAVEALQQQADSRRSILATTTPRAHHITPTLHHITPTLHHITPTLHHITPTLHHITPTLHHITPTLHIYFFQQQKKHYQLKLCNSKQYSRNNNTKSCVMWYVDV
jgi:NH3-dependent NAD+ synthetase